MLVYQYNHLLAKYCCKMPCFFVLLKRMTYSRCWISKYYFNKTFESYLKHFEHSATRDVFTGASLTNICCKAYKLCRVKEAQKFQYIYNNSLGKFQKVPAYLPFCLSGCKIKNGRWGSQSGQQGWKVFTLKLLGALVNFS